jgi:hypothetical protein
MKKLIVTVAMCALVTPAMASSLTFVNGICVGNNTTPGSTKFNPNDPVLSGYNLVFDSEFNNKNDIDLTCNAQPSSGGCQTPQGKNWYVNGWTFPNNVNKLSDYTLVYGLSSVSTKPVLKIHQDQKTGNWALSSMGPHRGASHGPNIWEKNWNGTLFAGGWYLEGRISGEFKNSSGNIVPAPGAIGAHPSIWAYAADNLNSGPGLWPGQGNHFFHFAEDDLMDGYQDGHFYVTDLIDWNGSGPTGTSAQIMPTTIKFNQVDLTKYGFASSLFVDRHSFHVYGQRWVPATGSSKGFVQNYFDGALTASFTWDRYNPSAPPPPTGQNIGNIIDFDHMSVNLGDDPSTNPSSSIYLDWVHVWQTPAAAMASLNSATGIKPQPNFTGANGSCHL